MSNMDSNTNLEILMLFKECSPTFLVLSEEARQKIVMLLAESNDGMNVNTITENIALSRPAVSHHLKILKQTGIIDSRKVGTENYYYLTLRDAVEKIKDLINMVENNCILR